MANPLEAPDRRQSGTAIDAAATAFESLAERPDLDGALTQPIVDTDVPGAAVRLPYATTTDVAATTLQLIHAPIPDPPATMRLNRLVSDRGMPKYSRTTLQ